MSSTAFRFPDADEKGAAGLLQRSLSAPTPEESGSFLAAVMAAGGSMARSSSTSDSYSAVAKKSISAAPGGPKAPTIQSPQANGVASPTASRTPGIASRLASPTSSDVDASMNEDLFYSSVRAAAAVTLSPSFGPSSPSSKDQQNGGRLLNYLGGASGSSTWAMPPKDQMPPLGLPKTAAEIPQKTQGAQPAQAPSLSTQSQQSLSPRSPDGQYRMRLSSAGSSASLTAQTNEANAGSDVFQLGRAMSGLQLGGGGTISSPTQTQFAPQQQQQQQQQMSRNSGSYAGLYEPSQQFMPMYYGGAEGPGGYDYGYPQQVGYGGQMRYPQDMYNGAGGMGSVAGQSMGSLADRYDTSGSFGYPQSTYMGDYAQQPQGQRQYGGVVNSGAMLGGRPPMHHQYGGHHQHMPTQHQRSGSNNFGGQVSGGRNRGSASAVSGQHGWYNGEDYAMGMPGSNGSPRPNNGGRGSMLDEVRSSMRAQSGNSGGHSRHHQGRSGSYGMRGGNMNGYMGHHPQQQAPHVPAVNYTLADVRGHAIEFAQDQFGSRWLQLQLQSSTVPAEDKQALFLELLPAAKTLASDTFGNYCVQILLNPQVGTPEQQLTLCKSTFEGNMVSLSRNTYACRCIQSLIKLFQLGDSIIPLELQDKMLHELEPEIISLITDSNANHVAQQVIERVRPIERISFVLDSMNGKYTELSKDPYGCRVCQRVLEHASPRYVESALEELLANVDDLITDSMGNYVVQHIITGANSELYTAQKQRLVEVVKRKLYFYATHKFASNVVEKILEFGDAKVRREIIQQMLDGQAPLTPNGPMVPMLQMMMSDLFANYVCQRSLAVAERDQLIRLVAIVRGNIQDLRRMPYGKHIIAACERAAAAAGIP